jgi:hypothetical protein
MRFTWPYQVLIIFLVTVLLMDVASLTTPEEHAKNSAENVIDMISGTISRARFKTTKSTLMKHGSKYFHTMLGSKQNLIPSEISTPISFIFFRKLTLMLS